MNKYYIYLQLFEFIIESPNGALGSRENVGQNN